MSVSREALTILVAFFALTTLFLFGVLFSATKWSEDPPQPQQFTICEVGPGRSMCVTGDEAFIRKQVQKGIMQ